MDPVEKAKLPIQDDDTPGMKISKVLFHHFPGMESGDVFEVTKAACITADVLGCVVALLRARLKPEDWEQVKNNLVDRIDRSTEDIVKTGTALRESRDAPKH